MSHLDIRIVDFDAGRTDELVLMWRESFEFGVGIVDPHPIAEQRRYFMATVVPNDTVRLALLGGSVVGFIAATADSISQLYVRKGHHRRGIGPGCLPGRKRSRAGRFGYLPSPRTR